MVHTLFVLMKPSKLLFILLVALLSRGVHPLKAQSIVLNIVPGECVSCRAYLSQMAKFHSYLPIMAIFKDHLRADSAEIEYLAGIQDLRLRYVFNNQMYDKYVATANPGSTSNWFLYDQHGSLVSKGNLKSLQPDSIRTQIETLLQKLPVTNRAHLYFSDKYLSVFDSRLSRIDLYDKTDYRPVKKFRSSEFDFNELVKNLSTSDSLAFVQKGFRLTNGLGFKPRYSWAYLTPNENLIGMFEYIQPTIIRDSFHYEIRKAVAHFTIDSDTPKIYPVNFASEDTLDNYAARFVYAGDNRFLTFTHGIWFDNLLKKDPHQSISYITLYELDPADKSYRPIRQYQDDLPEIYRTKYFENELSPELSSYPYVLTRFGNEIRDIENGRSAAIIDTVDYHRYLVAYKSQKGKEYLTVLSSSVRKDGQVFIAYRLEQDAYVNIYDPELKLLERVYIGGLLKDNPVDEFFIDSDASQVYFSFQTETYMIAMPFSLLAIPESLSSGEN